jgi:hypothetical protein
MLVDLFIHRLCYVICNTLNDKFALKMLCISIDAKAGIILRFKNMKIYLYIFMDCFTYYDKIAN